MPTIPYYTHGRGFMLLLLMLSVKKGSYKYEFMIFDLTPPRCMSTKRTIQMRFVHFFNLKSIKSFIILAVLRRSV